MVRITGVPELACTASKELLVKFLGIVQVCFYHVSSLKSAIYGVEKYNSQNEKFTIEAQE